MKRRYARVRKRDVSYWTTQRDIKEVNPIRSKESKVLFLSFSFF
jgi:hypothetical protein